jgi:TPR repeat protein
MAAEGGDPDALLAVSLQYDPQNAWFVDADVKKSTEYLVRAAEAGQQQALLWLVELNYGTYPPFQERVSNVVSRAVMDGNREVIQALKDK